MGEVTEVRHVAPLFALLVWTAWVIREENRTDQFVGEQVTGWNRRELPSGSLGGGED